VRVPTGTSSRSKRSLPNPEEWANSPIRFKPHILDLIARLGPELGILMDVPLADIRAAGGEVLAEAVARVRNGKVSIAAGYDGEYGVIKIFNDTERKKIKVSWSFFNPDFSMLNDEQRAAVDFNGGNLLITAGPGTGKTRTLTERVIRLAGALSAGQKALVITFTNKAAGELQERLSAGGAGPAAGLRQGLFTRSRCPSSGVIPPGLNSP